MGKGHIKEVRREEIKMANKYMKKNLTSSVKKCKPKQRDILIYHNSKWCEEMDVGSINLYSLSLQFDSICGKV